MTKPKVMFRLLGAIFVIALLTGSVAVADMAPEMTIQGRLTDADGAPLSGSALLYFTIYTSEVSGTMLWPPATSENHMVDLGDDGLWTVRIGTVYPITSDVYESSEQWLDVFVEHEAVGESMPRVKLTTSPYSFRVGTVDGAEGGFISSWVYAPNVQTPNLDVGSQVGGGTIEYMNGHGPYVNLRINADDNGPRMRMYDDDGSFIGMWETDADGDASHIECSSPSGYLQLDGNYMGGGSPKFQLYGASSGITIATDVTGNSSIVLPNSSISKNEILDEPGVAWTYNTGTVVLGGTGSYESVIMHSINPPSDGYILANLTCYLSTYHTSGSPNSLEAGLSDNATSVSQAQDVNCMVPAGAGSGTYQIPASYTWLISTGGAIEDVYFLAKETNGSWSISDITLNLLYVPNAYSALASATAGEVDIADDSVVRVGSLTPEDIERSRARARQFNVDRISRELAEMKAEVDALKADMKNATANDRAENR